MTHGTKLVVRLQHHNTLHDMLVEIQYELQSRKPNTISAFESSYGEMFTVSDVSEDGEGDFYVVSYPSLPTDVYAEIEDGTYGELQGWRVFI